jgi:hypothetical protein
MAAHSRPIDAGPAAELHHGALQGPKGELQWTFVPEVSIVEVSSSRSSSKSSSRNQSGHQHISTLG